MGVESPGVAADVWHEPVGHCADRERAGASFHGDWPFADVQSPGVTVAIHDPWERGSP